MGCATTGLSRIVCSDKQSWCWHVPGLTFMSQRGISVVEYNREDFVAETIALGSCQAAGFVAGFVADWIPKNTR